MTPTHVWVALATVVFVAFVWVLSVRSCLSLHKDLRDHATPRQRKVLTAIVNLLMLAATVITLIVIGGILLFWKNQ